MRYIFIMIWIHACIIRAFDVVWQLFHASVSLTTLSLFLSCGFACISEKERERDHTLERDINLIESAHPLPPGRAVTFSHLSVCVSYTPAGTSVRKGPLVLLVKSWRFREEMILQTVRRRTEEGIRTESIYLPWNWNSAMQNIAWHSNSWTFPHSHTY